MKKSSPKYSGLSWNHQHMTAVVLPPLKRGGRGGQVSGIIFSWPPKMILTLSLLLLSGCTSTAAKKALNKPNAPDAYSGFDPDTGAASKRKAEKVEPLKEDAEPEEAVNTLVKYLQRDRAYAISAEEQLYLWGARQGIGKIVVSKVQLLLKHPKVDVRAPALRLTMRFGGESSNGDLIECLADSEYSIREAAYKALKAKAHRDFGYDPSGGEVARAKAVDDWRQWWQAEQRKIAVQPPSVYELNPPSQPKVVKPGGE